MKLGEARWQEAQGIRRTLVAPHPADSSKVLDLNRIESIRLGKLGEGEPQVLADALVPKSLRSVLRAGQRGLLRARQAWAYALKWHRRSGLPREVTLPVESLEVLSSLGHDGGCLRSDGTLLVLGSGPGLEPRGFEEWPVPSLGLVGMGGGKVAGVCLAIQEGGKVHLGHWLRVGALVGERIFIRRAGAESGFDTCIWKDLDITPPGAGRVLVLPSPVLPMPLGLGPGMAFSVESPFDSRVFQMGAEVHHRTIQ